MSFWILAPRFAPLNCGIGDYAALLLEQLRLRHGILGGVLVASSDWPAEQAPASPLSRRWSGTVPSDLGALFLQYSGYGYARRGAPVRLLQQMVHMKRERPEVRLVTMFHELYASGPPTSSAFWLSPVQRWVASRIARLSETVVTNRQQSAAWLERHAPQHRGRVRVLPVFSNFGQVYDAPPPSQRDNHLVFFGYQSQLWDPGFAGLRQVVLALQPSHVTVLGRGVEVPANIFGNVPVTSPGWLDAAAVSAILRTARYGMLAYNPEFLGKSGILAAFLAHGVVPLLVEGDKPLSEGLRRGTHLLALPDLLPGHPPEGLDDVAHAGHVWYQAHDLQHTASFWGQTFASMAAT